MIDQDPFSIDLTFAIFNPRVLDGLEAWSINLGLNPSRPLCIDLTHMWFICLFPKSLINPRSIKSFLYLLTYGSIYLPVARSIKLVDPYFSFDEPRSIECSILHQSFNFFYFLLILFPNTCIIQKKKIHKTHKEKYFKFKYIEIDAQICISKDTDEIPSHIPFSNPQIKAK